jgi:hypothetical protein
VKANHPLLAVAATLLIASCVAPPKPAPAPPAVVMAPIPRPVAMVPPPLPKPPADWRDAAQSPGTWRWGLVQGRSTASFVAPGGAIVASLACNRTAAQVLLSRAGPGGEAHQPIAVTTSNGTRPLLSEPLLSAPGWLTVELRPVDPILDAIAFSRGRFALEAAGQPPLYLPSWPELSRVVEDCR